MTIDFKLIARCKHCHSVIDYTERFWSRVDKTNLNGCWLWKGAKTKGYGQVRGREWGGYGQVKNDGKMLYAHRIAFQLTNGTIPPKLVVCHTCDTPLCVNPAHLYLGTDADNMRDQLDRGRRWRSAKLTKEQVLEIRKLAAEGVANGVLAKKFEIGPPSITRIVSRKSWQHIQW